MPRRPRAEPVGLVTAGLLVAALVLLALALTSILCVVGQGDEAVDELQGIQGDLGAGGVCAPAGMSAEGGASTQGGGLTAALAYVLTGKHEKRRGRAGDPSLTPVVRW